MTVNYNNGGGIGNWAASCVYLAVAILFLLWALRAQAAPGFSAASGVFLWGVRILFALISLVLMRASLASILGSFGFRVIDRSTIGIWQRDWLLVRHEQLHTLSPGAEIRVTEEIERHGLAPHRSWLIELVQNGLALTLFRTDRKEDADSIRENVLSALLK